MPTLNMPVPPPIQASTSSTTSIPELCLTTIAVLAPDLTATPTMVSAGPPDANPESHKPLSDSGPQLDSLFWGWILVGIIATLIVLGLIWFALWCYGDRILRKEAARDRDVERGIDVEQENGVEERCPSQILGVTIGDEGEKNEKLGVVEGRWEEQTVRGIDQKDVRDYVEGMKGRF